MAEDRCPKCGGHRSLPRILHDDIDNPKECADQFHKEPAPAIVEEPPKPPEVAVMPTPQPPKGPVIKPVCPYCKNEGGIVGVMTTLGQVCQVMVVRCANNECRAILFGFQPLAFEMVAPNMMPVPPGKPS